MTVEGIRRRLVDIGSDGGNDGDDSGGGGGGDLLDDEFAYVGVPPDEDDNEDSTTDQEELEGTDRRTPLLVRRLGPQEDNKNNSNNHDNQNWTISYKLACGGVTAGVLLAIYLWKDAGVALDMITMALSLISIVYIWTNG